MEFIPYVIEQTSKGERSFDLYSRILQDRIIFVGEINSQSARSIRAQMIYLQSVNDKAPIQLYIDSPGGEIYAGLSIIDTMNFVTCPIHTYGMGICASFGAVILACGDKGFRFGLPNLTSMIHQPLGGAKGQATDIAIEANEILRLKSLLNKMLSDATGQSIETIERDTDRDNFMTAEQALAYGLIDAIVGSK